MSAHRTPALHGLVLAFVAIGLLDENNKPAFKPIFAQVLGINITPEEDQGSDGEPMLTLAYLDIKDDRKLSGPDWHEQFQRRSGVRHGSHEKVASGAEGIYWVEPLPTAEEAAAELDRFNALLAATQTPAASIEEPSYLDHKEDGFAGEGDPYNMAAYTDQSFQPPATSVAPATETTASTETTGDDEKNKAPEQNGNEAPPASDSINTQNAGGEETTSQPATGDDAQHNDTQQ